MSPVDVICLCGSLVTKWTSLDLPAVSEICAQRWDAGDGQRNPGAGNGDCGRSQAVSKQKEGVAGCDSGPGLFFLLLY